MKKDVFVEVRVFSDRRLMVGQRRARGHGDARKSGNGGLRWLHFPNKYGRRMEDEAAHKDRRQPESERPANQRAAEILGWVNPRRRKGDERRGIGYSLRGSPKNRMRRAGDERRSSVFPYSVNLRRRKGDERRVRHPSWNDHDYAHHPDPRVQAMNRRGKPIDFGRPFAEQPMAKRP